MSQRATLFAFALLSLCTFLLGYFGYFNFHRESKSTEINNQRGTSFSTDKISDGYTLIAPYSSSDNYAKEGMVILVDNSGKAVHKWVTPHPVLHAFFNKKGHLMIAMTPPMVLMSKPISGMSGIIQELDWGGKVLWEYKNELLHHDFDMLPSGEIAAMTWEEVPASYAEKVKGGFFEKEYPAMIGDRIILVDKTGSTTWSWSAFQHLNPAEYELGPLTPRHDWTHGNSVTYLEKNPINGTEGFLFSMRHVDAVVIIEKSTGNILWRSPRGYLAYQHDASLLPDGNILIFDNGLMRKQSRPALASRVIAINPKTNKIVWEFNGGRGAEALEFAVSAMGGADALPNGNILMTLSTSGRLVEVTKEGVVAWDFVSPYALARADGPGHPFPSTVIFKARKYSLDEIPWITEYL